MRALAAILVLTASAGIGCGDDAVSSHDGGAGTGGDGGFVLYRVHYLKPSDTMANEEFGGAVAVAGDGNTIAVGASRHDDHGTVYVFARSGASWTQQAELVASNTQLSDEFGVSVSLSFDGDTLAVGASGADAGALESGAAYVFSRAGTQWTEHGELVADPPVPTASFGDVLSLSADGNTLMAGARSESRATGAAYIFRRASAAEPFAQRARLIASDGQAEDYFGCSGALSADGSRAAIGSFGASGGVGAVYTFSAGTDGMTEEAKIMAPAPKSGDALGVDVAISGAGDWLIAGAFQSGGYSSPGSGVAFAYARDPQWQPVATLRAENAGVGDQFGAHLALSSDATTAVIGAPREDGSGDDNLDTGAAYVYVRKGTVWAQTAALRVPNGGVSLEFGTPAISADARVIAVGARFESNDARGVDNMIGVNADASESGAVYVFE